MKIYLAGPLFTCAERTWNRRLASALNYEGHFVFLPQDEEPREKTAHAIFDMDVQGIEQSDAVVAIMDGADPDSGTCWEVGYAYARNKFAPGRKKPILLVRTDFRKAGDAEMAPYNLMLTESADSIRNLPFVSTEEVAIAISVWAKEHEGL